MPPFAHSPESHAGPWFFCLRHAVHDGAIGIAMVGELDVAAADEARDVIARARADAAEVICDLHDVSFIDPCGLRVLLDATAGGRPHGGRVTLANPSACVRRSFRRFGLQPSLQAGAAPSAPPPTDRGARPSGGLAAPLRAERLRRGGGR